jgi:hypothetical protein
MLRPRSPSLSPIVNGDEYVLADDRDDRNDREDRHDRDDRNDREDRDDREDREEKKEQRVLKIKELDINQLRPRSVDDDGVKYAMIGKPGTGKSSIIKSYMYAKRHIFPVGPSCNGTEDSTQFFSKHVPDLFIHPLSTSLVSQFIRRQKLARQYLDNPWSLFITDDLHGRPEDLQQAPSSSTSSRTAGT